MKIVTDQPVILQEDRIFERPEASAFDKATRRIAGLEYDPARFQEAFAAILNDDEKYKTATAKCDAIVKAAPWWGDHIDKVLTDEAKAAIG